MEKTLLHFANPRALLLIALSLCALPQASAAAPRPSILDQNKSSAPNREYGEIGRLSGKGKTISEQREISLPGGMGLIVTIKRAEGRPESFRKDWERTRGSGRVAYIERTYLPQKNHALHVQIVVRNPAKAHDRAASRMRRPQALQSKETSAAKVVGHFDALPKDRIALWGAHVGPHRNFSGKMESLLSDGRQFDLKLWRVNRQLVEKETKQVITLPDGGTWIRTYTPMYRNDKPSKQPKFQYTLITQSFVSGKPETFGPQAAKPGHHQKGKTAGRPRALKESLSHSRGSVTPDGASRVVESATNTYYLNDGFDFSKLENAAEKINSPISAISGAEFSIFAEPSMKAKALRKKSNQQQLSGNDKEVDSQWLQLRERGYVPRRLIASEQILGADYFSKTISGLKKDQHWLIIGPGVVPDEADAYFHNSDQELHDKGYRFSGDARITAIGTEPMTLSHKRLCQMMKGKYVYRAGKPLEKYTAKQIQKIGQADLVTDQFSAITYTNKLDLMIEKELGFVKKGGTLLFNLSSRTKILDAAGVNVAAAYLKAITGVTTTINTIESDGMTHYQVKMVKNDDNPFVPRLRLAKDGYQMGNPPLRSFLFTGTGAASATSVAAP